MVPKTHQRKLSEIGEILIKQKEELGYASSSIRSCENDIKHLSDFMEKEGDVLYCIEVGQRYLSSDYCNSTDIKRAMSESFISQLNDCLFRGKFDLYHCRKEVVSTPDRYFVLEEAYTEWCKEKGNGPVTLQHKHHAFACFFSFLESIGCDDVSGITPEHIIKAVSNEKSPDNHRYFREILKFLAEKEIVTFDYSALVPKARSSFHLPSTYDKDERKLLEGSPDRSKALGKRNYAVILLANRLGIRSGDIAGMTFGEVCFDQDRIIFSQEKTEDVQELYLVKDVKDALLDYIENGRPDSDDEHIFLGFRAPHHPIDSSTIYSIIAKGFHDAGIDTGGKKHGGHALRASLATDMVNTGESYEQTRKVLGHRSPDVIKHYAKLDVERLRLCALEARPPAGFFERFLNGEEVFS